MQTFRINPERGMEIGIYTLGDRVKDPKTGEQASEKERMQAMLKMARLSEQAGLDVFGVGESHQEKFIASATSTILGTIAGQTQNIKLISAASVLSTTDPVRLYEEFASLDLLSNGRAEIVAGRGSRFGAYALFGYDRKDYEELYEEKIELLNQLNTQKKINWTGKFRPALQDAAVFPHPVNSKLPIWRAVGGKPASGIKAAKMGLPMHLAALYGPSSTFKRAVDAYRETAAASGYHPEELPVALATMLYAADDSQTALKEYFPYLDNTFKELRGVPFSKDTYAEAASTKNAIMVGSPQQIIEKVLYQYELYGHNRFMVQIDHGGIPEKQVEKTIDVLANVIAPALRKATQK